MSNQSKLDQTILVTGGAGFIGSHLCEKLLAQNQTVICVDNFFTGRKQNIIHLLGNPNFELIRHDITLPLYLEVDQIYNLACPASPVHYQENPVKTIKMGTVAMVNILGLAKRCQARILQASTSEVYGDPKEHPQREEYWGNVNPIGPRSCYDEGKRVAESLCFAYQKQNKVDVKIVRIFNTYGPKMSFNDGRVVSNFIVQALGNKPLTIYGSGSQTRSFCYVDDMVRGMMLMMEKDDFAGPVNLGNPDEKSVKELADMIIEMSGSKSKIEFHDLPQDDPVRRLPAIDLAQKELGWMPQVDLEKGLDQTIEWFHKEMSN